MSIPPQSPQYPAGPPQFQPYQAQPYGLGYGDTPPGWAPAGLANIGARFGARVLDVIFWYVGYFIVAFPVMMWMRAGGGAPATALLSVCLVASFVLYFAVSIWKFGSTLGKRICGVRIVRRQTAAPMGFWRAVGREAFWLVAVVMPVLGLLNPLWCCWDKPYQQCLHDKIADSMAVRR
ncbi:MULTISPECIES: RDD family protein [unclassified Streptomyces]|uniref:RDD family protein n=1 Tax=unclassified Streptomyces TaxID=2593676 RepID=UPI001448959C|nr:RDD family protein [Streptomyces sp. A1136]